VFQLSRQLAPTPTTHPASFVCCLQTSNFQQAAEADLSHRPAAPPHHTPHPFRVPQILNFQKAAEANFTVAAYEGSTHSAYEGKWLAGQLRDYFPWLRVGELELGPWQQATGALPDGAGGRWPAKGQHRGSQRSQLGATWPEGEAG